MKLHLMILACALPLMACASQKEKADEQLSETVADTIAKADTGLYAEMQQRDNCFIVISKQELKLYVCETVGADTVRLVEYPVCIGRNIGPKQKTGDMKTPESTWGNPFKITQIQDASTWVHDFGDGRGAIQAYGHWFMRLLTPGFSGIGIHGSTNNENSVPGRDSEGCIRLPDNDLLVLKERYAFKGMKVFIKGEEEGLKPFEEKYY